MWASHKAGRQLYESIAWANRTLEIIKWDRPHFCLNSTKYFKFTHTNFSQHSRKSLSSWPGNFILRHTSTHTDIDGVRGKYCKPKLSNSPIFMVMSAVCSILVDWRESFCIQLIPGYLCAESCGTFQHLNLIFVENKAPQRAPRRFNHCSHLLLSDVKVHSKPLSL